MEQNYRNSIFGIVNGKSYEIILGQWGGGEYKLSDETESYATLYIPYLNHESLTKAIVYLKHINSVTDVIVGYLQYSRQDRNVPNKHEVRLDTILLTPLIKAIPRSAELTIVDIHNFATVLACDVNKRVHNFNVIPYLLDYVDEYFTSEYNLVAPDAGCEKRYRFDFDVVCEKIRFKNGVRVELKRDDSWGDTFVIVDDICDGGRTFIETAKSIRSKYPVAIIYLVVTHAILPYGCDSILEYIDQIITTDTCQNKSGNSVTVLNIAEIF